MKRLNDYFFGGEDEDVKPYFYGSLAFGIVVAIITIAKIY